VDYGTVDSSFSTSLEQYARSSTFWHSQQSEDTMHLNAEDEEISYWKQQAVYATEFIVIKVFTVFCTGGHFPEKLCLQQRSYASLQAVMQQALWLTTPQIFQSHTRRKSQCHLRIIFLPFPSNSILFLFFLSLRLALLRSQTEAGGRNYVSAILARGNDNRITEER